MSIKYPMFWPALPDREKLLEELNDTLDGRWIGQGPKVDQFELEFKRRFDAGHAVAVNSCTAALHLAYLLAGIKPGDSVISPVFTCTATNHALLYLGANILFADVDVNMNVNPEHVRMLCHQHDVKAIVAAHIGGVPCQIEKLLGFEVPVIFDAAQSLGACYQGVSIDSFINCGFATCHSFQAIKHVTTGDGGMICLRDQTDADRARRLRWFDIDRKKRQEKYDWKPWNSRGITVDQEVNGYKYQMTDVEACFGLVGLRQSSKVFNHYFNLYDKYHSILIEMNGVWVPPHVEGMSPSLFMIQVERRNDFCRAMESRGVETNMVQLRNDVYTVFGGKRQDLPRMNSVEELYVYLPFNMKISLEDAEEICSLIGEGW